MTRIELKQTYRTGTPICTITSQNRLQFSIKAVELCKFEKYNKLSFFKNDGNIYAKKDSLGSSFTKTSGGQVIGGGTEIVDIFKAQFVSRKISVSLETIDGEEYIAFNEFK